MNNKTSPIVDAAIRQRRSIYPRQFLAGAQIPDSVIDHLLDNARYTPTHRLTQPWRFIVFGPNRVADFFGMLESTYRERTPVENISPIKIKKYKQKAEQCSHVIVLVMERDLEERVPEIEEVCATAAAAQNIYLSLDAHDVAGYWSTGLAFTPELAQHLALVENQQCLGYFLLGVKDPDAIDAPRLRKPLSQVAEYRY